MAQQHWTRETLTLLGLLVLTLPGRADEAAAIEAVKKLDGWVIFDAGRPGIPVVAVNLGHTQDRRSTEGLKGLPGITGVEPQLYRGHRRRTEETEEIPEFARAAPQSNPGDGGGGKGIPGGSGGSLYLPLIRSISNTNSTVGEQERCL